MELSVAPPQDPHSNSPWSVSYSCKVSPIQNHSAPTKPRRFPPFDVGDLGEQEPWESTCLEPRRAERTEAHRRSGNICAGCRAARFRWDGPAQRQQPLSQAPWALRSSVLLPDRPELHPTSALLPQAPLATSRSHFPSAWVCSTSPETCRSWRAFSSRSGRRHGSWWAPAWSPNPSASPQPPPPPPPISDSRCSIARGRPPPPWSASGTWTWLWIKLASPGQCLKDKNRESTPCSGLTKDAKSPPFHHSKRDKSVMLRSDAAGWYGRALLTGNCLTVVLLVLHHLPRCDVKPPPPSPVLFAPRWAALQWGTSPRGISKHHKTKHQLQEKKMPALISHLVMQEEAAADFPLERAIVFLLDADGWRVSVRSWMQVISSPSFAPPCPRPGQVAVGSVQAKPPAAPSELPSSLQLPLG